MTQQNFYYADSNGNDFIIILKDNLSINLNSSTIKSLCNFQDKPVDGLLLIETNYKDYDFIVPSKDISKTINKMKFSLKKIDE